MGRCDNFSSERIGSWTHFIHVLKNDMSEIVNNECILYADDSKLIRFIQKEEDVLDIWKGIDNLHEWAKTINVRCHLTMTTAKLLEFLEKN